MPAHAGIQLSQLRLIYLKNLDSRVRGNERVVRPAGYRQRLIRQTGLFLQAGKSQTASFVGRRQ